VSPYTIPQDPYGFLKNDYGPSDYNQPSRLLVDFVWAIPPPNRNPFLTGWTLSGIFAAQNGQPFTIFSGPVLGELTQRVNLTGPLATTGNPAHYISSASDITLPSASCATGPALSPYVTGTTQLFSGTAGSPCLGTTGRNQFMGPSYVDFDIAAQKQFQLGEKLNLMLRAEFYNFFNHPNYYNPISTYSLDGVTPYSQFGEIKSAHEARRIQFGIRMNW
jgi:hypothetical protein